MRNIRFFPCVILNLDILISTSLYSQAGHLNNDVIINGCHRVWETDRICPTRFDVTCTQHLPD